MSYDVVIIGSGAGGGTAAWSLSRQGMKVLVLEAGPSYSSSDYRLDKSEWESPFPNKHDSHSSYTVTPLQTLSDQHKDIRSWNHISGFLNKENSRDSYGYHHVQGVGGSSLHFTGEAHRLNPASMKMKSRFGMGADWPLKYEQLDPYYLEAEQFVGVAGDNKDKRCPRSGSYNQSSHPLSYASKVLQKGFHQLGLTTQPNSLAVLSRATAERPPCNYCGGCLRGCPREDKGSIDITYIRAALKTGYCDLKTECAVVRIEAGDKDRVKGVHYFKEGKQHFLETKALIVAGGAIHTPRLLLNSESRNSPNGLGNESGMVGKNLMETLLWTSSAMYPDNLGSYRGLPVDFICWDFNAPDSIPGVIGGCRFGPAQSESDLVGPKNYATRVIDGWGVAHKQAMRRDLGKVLSVAGIAESLPHSGSWVGLSSKTDRHGVPLAEIHSHLDDMAVQRIRFMAEMSRKILDAAGAGKVFEEFSSYDIFSSTHVFGTCRMGEDEHESVVDSWCRSHRWKNLYIMDASVFPSSGGGESPGLTIQALALRCCDEIVRRAGRSEH